MRFLKSSKLKERWEFEDKFAFLGGDIIDGQSPCILELGPSSPHQSYSFTAHAVFSSTSSIALVLY